MGKWEKFFKNYAMSLIALITALVVIFFVLNMLHQRFGSNVVGRVAGTVGSRASGQAYTFGN